MSRVFLTGATGVMGMAGLRHLMQTRYSDGAADVTVLARDTKTNRRKLAPFMARGVKVIWGDLLNPGDVKAGVDWADIVLHVGGMVSPMADWYPEKTYRVNTGAMRNVVDAALERIGRGERVKVVYIGSVSQYGDRREPTHWGRTGDPVSVATFDRYALSKNEAERMLAESGLEEWVSLRQTGIIYPRILMKGSDPISFHVPVRGCLEWVTAEDSGRLLAALADPSLPATFWRRFYNIGGGEGFRLTNYDFISLTLAAVGCPPIERVFSRNWFATRNFHGIWYTDSDLLDSILHFRSGGTMRGYLEMLRKGLPWYFRLTPLAPAWIIRMAMKHVARTKVLGPLRWLEDGDEERIYAAFGGREEYAAIPSWDADARWELSRTPRRLDHGYDESIPLEALSEADLQHAAEFRGGRLLTAGYKAGEIDRQLEWECGEGHRFTLRPRTLLLGGHWCPACLREISDSPYALGRQAEKNRFLAQTIVGTHNGASEY